ncbi:PadR family transcriptional regulator [Actinoplanes couchii]|uniref:Transcriptional regulator n=1 Tax=Actinoplanes couchii TaxID=403638 RepID=A0ABQ3XNX9_9ACTN|nr:helix-turn-helix transcriptional regulator [Actinoplanes couchii]MDR6319675.1 DNA-binding PadR family transcriptional regulator [Actinoplanes couchii]GID60105.1 transcriptional regulator [Actinoplanes couchii]
MALRMTTPRLLALQAFLDDPGREWYGLELAQHAGLEPGTIYPILVAFESAGWLSSRDDDIDPHVEGRPRRRYYLLTAEGLAASRQWTEAVRRRRAPRVARPAEGIA